MASRHRELVKAVTPEQYAELLDRQGGVCAICGNPPKVRRLNVDHDHRTMEVRGLLCHRCNRNLPPWVDDVWCWRAGNYLHSPPAQR